MKIRVNFWCLLLAFWAMSSTAARSDINARILCMGNLKQIDGAVYRWAQENHLSGTNTYSLQDKAILRNLPGGYMMNCPAGGSYQPGKTVDDEPRCTVHGSLTDIQHEYLAARKRHNSIQIALGLGAGLLVWFTVRWLNRWQRAGRITESNKQWMLPGVLLLMGIMTLFMPQDTLRPTFGIVRTLLYVPTVVFCLSGLILAIAAMLRGRKASLIVLCIFSGISAFILSSIILYWLTIVRR